MKKTIVFRGAATALVTPFDEKGIDYIAFAKMIDFQLANGIDALVVCGTTGESATLTDEEKKKLDEILNRNSAEPSPFASSQPSEKSNGSPTLNNTDASGAKPW